MTRLPNAQMLSVLALVFGFAGCGGKGVACSAGQGCTSGPSNSTTTPPHTGGTDVDIQTGSGVMDTTTGQNLISTGFGYTNPSTGAVWVATGSGYINPATGQFVFNSAPSDVKDVDLEKAGLEDQELQSRARAMADHFGMSFDSAMKVTRLADRMGALTRDGGQKLTAEDEAALIDQAYQVAGVDAAAVNAATQKLIQSGDHAAVDGLLDQAARNLGMASSASLRDQILPAIGINLN